MSVRMLWRRLKWRGKCLNHVHQVAFRANAFNHDAHQRGASVYETSVWCSIVGHFWKKTTGNGIPTLFGAPLETPACESEPARRPPQDSAHACRTRTDLCISYFLPLLDKTGVRYAICGKATQLSVGKSERQLYTPSLVPSKARLLSHTSDPLPSRFSFLFIDRTVSLSFATLASRSCVVSRDGVCFV